MRQLAEQKKVVDRWRGMEQRTSEVAELISLEDDSLAAEIEAEVEKLASRLVPAAPNRRTGRRC
jgi:hypothetical protein